MRKQVNSGCKRAREEQHRRSTKAKPAARPSSCRHARFRSERPTLRTICAPDAQAGMLTKFVRSLDWGRLGGWEVYWGARDPRNQWGLVPGPMQTTARAKLNAVLQAMMSAVAMSPRDTLLLAQVGEHAQSAHEAGGMGGM